MTSLSRLDIHNVRILRNIELRGLKKVNVFTGRNGSGKTSLLEAIHLLGMARSFRGNTVKSLVSHGESECTVFGVMDSAGRERKPIGVTRYTNGEFQIKVDGDNIRNIASLVEHLPLQVINADSFQLLVGTPGNRRQYLDWGVFHVEHRFLTQWQRFQRCIKQRNNLLRRGKIDRDELTVWTTELIQSGNAINDFRKAYLQVLVPEFNSVISRLIPSLDQVEIRYRQGWDKQLGLDEALQHSEKSDLEQGFTHVGPQRADLKIYSGGKLAADVLSRGQQKLVTCSLKLAQGTVLQKLGRGACLFLLDDLPSELDREHSSLVCEMLSIMDAQIFITCVSAAEIADVWPAAAKKDMAMFHVEHGGVKLMDTVSSTS